MSAEKITLSKFSHVNAFISGEQSLYFRRHGEGMSPVQDSTILDYIQAYYKWLKIFK